MTPTLYASFTDVQDAERAIGALLDHQVKPKDISLVANEAYSDRLKSFSTAENIDLRDFENHAKTGITVTTPGDVEAGAMTGAGVGLGVGVVAALASVFLPGIGMVLGGGALALALAGAAATTGAGAIAGGVIGLLKDQGVPEQEAEHYSSTVASGGAIIAVRPTGMAMRSEIEGILRKYNGQDIRDFSPNWAD